MEDVADGVPETVEEVEQKSESLDDYKSDVDFLSRNDDKEEATDLKPSEQAEEELEGEEEKVEKVEKPETEEDKIQPPLSAKDLVDRLNKTNPDFLRKNKDVRKAIYDSAQYNELFSHPDEATEVVENMRAMDRLAGQIMQGDAKALLYNIESTKKDSLRQFAKNFPTALYERDKSVFYDEIASPIISSGLREMIEEAKKSGNDNLRKAANWASQYFFNQPEPPVAKGRERDPEKERLQQELKGNTIAVYQQQKADLRLQMDDHIGTIVTKDLPRDASDKLKLAFARDVMDELEDTLSQDPNHQRRMSALWDQLVESKFNPAIRNRIGLTYLNRVKLLLPGLIAKHKPGYFGTIEGKKTTKQIIPIGGAGKISSGRVTPDKIDWRKTSDLDILNKRVTLKK